MRSSSHSVRAADGASLFVHRSRPDAEGAPRGLVMVVHGMAEHGGRYAGFAEGLVEAGYAVCAPDLRGHGRTAASNAELGVLPEGHGFEGLVSDFERVLEAELADLGPVPYAVVGHSMGGYVVQGYLQRVRGEGVRGAAVIGPAGVPTPLAQAGRLVARLERRRLGTRGKSRFIDLLAFRSFNRVFAPNRTAFDFLSRDEEQVDRYVADPLCGFDCSTELWVAMLDYAAELVRPERLERLRKDLRLFIVAGSADPIGGQGENVVKLAEAYREAGLTEVGVRVYPGARHELLNETNRDEVERDLLGFLSRSFAPHEAGRSKPPPAAS